MKKQLSTTALSTLLLMTSMTNATAATGLAAFGGSGWTTSPVAFSNANGTFTVTNYAISNFASWAATPGVHVVTGDFNGDGRTDLAAYGGSGWTTSPVAFSNADGTFYVTNYAISNFASWAATPGVQVVTGNF